MIAFRVLVQRNAKTAIMSVHRGLEFARKIEFRLPDRYSRQQSSRVISRRARLACAGCVGLVGLQSVGGDTKKR